MEIFFKKYIYIYIYIYDFCIPKYGVYMISASGVVIMVHGIYFSFRYLDIEG